MKKKFAESLGPLNPFGAIVISLPAAILTQATNHSLTLRDAKKLRRELGWAISKHERDQKKFVRNLIKSNPWKKIFKPQKFPQV
jgi:hypothetical protein